MTDNCSEVKLSFSATAASITLDEVPSGKFARTCRRASLRSDAGGSLTSDIVPPSVELSNSTENLGFVTYLK
jgi:hypothetical protein